MKHLLYQIYTKDEEIKKIVYHGASECDLDYWIKEELEAEAIYNARELYYELQSGLRNRDDVLRDDMRVLQVVLENGYIRKGLKYSSFCVNRVLNVGICAFDEFKDFVNDEHCNTNYTQANKIYDLFKTPSREEIEKAKEIVKKRLSPEEAKIILYYYGFIGGYHPIYWLLDKFCSSMSITEFRMYLNAVETKLCFQGRFKDKRWLLKEKVDALRAELNKAESELVNSYAEKEVIPDIASIEAGKDFTLDNLEDHTSARSIAALNKAGIYTVKDLLMTAKNQKKEIWELKVPGISKKTMIKISRSIYGMYGALPCI